MSVQTVKFNSKEVFVDVAIDRQKKRFLTNIYRLYLSH